jgi:hypothetical protein
MHEQMWKEREPAIAALAKSFIADEIVSVGEPPVTVRLFFCHGVMDVVKYLRRETKGKEIGAQHHVFKILGKHASYSEEGRLEAGADLERMDIYFDDTMVAIEVKILIQATFKRIHKKAVAAFKSSPVDHVWIFFLYKFKDRATPKPLCQYLICWFAIDPLSDDPVRLVESVMATIEKAKKQAADVLRVPEEIFIPVENILKVEEMEREIEEIKSEKDKIITEKDEAIAEKDEAIAEKDEVIAEKDEAIAEKDEALAEKEKENQLLREQLGLDQ